MRRRCREVIDDANVFNLRLTQWEDYYNFDRPHGGLGGQTPYERLRQKTNTPTWTTYVSRTPRQGCQRGHGRGR